MTTSPTAMESQLRAAGIRGELRINESLAAGDPKSPVSRDEMDFRGIARWAMNYLEHNPVPEFNYQSRFMVYPSGMPIIPKGPDPISIGDTDCRCDWEFWFMREILGVDEMSKTEKGLRARIMSYVKDDHMAWCENGSAEEGKVYEGADITAGLGMNQWTTGKIIASLCEDYKRNGRRESLELAGKMAYALMKVASWDTGRAYIPEGFGPWVDGHVLKSGWERQFPVDITHLMFYYDTTKDANVLQYCRAMADAFIAELQPNRDIAGIGADGSHHGHAHITMKAVWGVAWLGEVLGHPKYIEFARRVYEFQRSHGYDTGWMAAAYWDTTAEKFCETCATSDMISVAACLARAGYLECWDHIERFVRNYIRHAQFFITDEYKAFYRNLYPGREAEVEVELAKLRDMEGGFCGSPGQNDLVGWMMSVHHCNVSGCCSPEGMRAIYTAWKNTVIERDDAIYVNMSLPVDAPAATITTALPDRGVVTATIHRNKNVYMRPPVWADRHAVRAFVNGNEITPKWQNDAILFESAHVGDKLTISYPLVCFTQTMGLDALIPKGDASESSADRGYVIINSKDTTAVGDAYRQSVTTFTWHGNSVVATDPVGPYLPIYRGAGKPLPPMR